MLVLSASGGLLLIVGVVLIVLGKSLATDAGVEAKGITLRGPVPLVLTGMGAGLLVLSVVLDHDKNALGEARAVGTMERTPSSSAAPPAQAPAASMPVTPPPTESVAAPSASRARTNPREKAATTRPNRPEPTAPVEAKTAPMPVEPKRVAALVAPKVTVTDPPPIAAPAADPPPATDMELVKKVAAKRQRYSEILWTTPQDLETAKKYATLMKDVLATHDVGLACKAVEDWHRYASANCQWVAAEVLELVAPQIGAINQQCGKESLATSELMRCAK